MSRFLNHLRRVIEEDGKIEVFNSKGKSLDVSIDMVKEINETEKIEKELITSRVNISDLKLKVAKLEKYKKVLEEMKLKKQLLDESPDGKLKRKLLKSDRMYAGNNDYEKDLYNILDMLDLL